MTVPAMLEELRARDIRVWLDGDQLQVEAPAGGMTTDLRDQLQRRKAEIREFLRAPAALSYSQQRLWFLDQLEPGGAAYVIAQAFEIRGALDVQALEKALGALVRRHDPLRTVFVTVEGRPRQVVLDPGPWALPVIDLTVESLTRRLREEAARGFDLAHGPLFRATLCRLAADTHVLLLTMHDIVSDGWSLGILYRELAELYAGFSRGEAAALPPLPIQYRDFSRWQRDWLQGENLEALLSHWRARLDGAPRVLELPADRARPPFESYRGATYPFTLPPELADRLRALGRSERATLFMTLLAGFTQLLARYCGEQDLLVGTPVASRSRVELEALVGCFVNTLVLRVDLSGSPSSAELLGRVRETCLDAFAHQELPFDRLVEELRPARDLSRNPLFQVMFHLQNAPVQPLRLPGLDVSALAVERGITQVDLTLQMQETAEGLDGFFEYATDLFDEATIARMAGHLRVVLEGMVDDPQARIGALPLLTQAERQQVLVEWNATQVHRPDGALFHKLFEAHAKRAPQAVAIVSGGRTLSYGELDQRANQLAHLLRKRGVGPDVLVALCANRTTDMIVAVLGVLKAGGAYVPLDPEYPGDRLAFMLEDCGAKVLVTEASLPASLASVPPGCTWICLDREALAAESRDAPYSETGPANLAYAIYTSGSTGRPKAALLTHRGLANLAVSEIELYGIGPHSRVLQFSSPSFDTSLSEIALALCSGARLHVEDRDRIMPGRDLERYLERERISVLSLTPSALAMIEPTAGPFLEQVIVGGEACPAELARSWAGRCRFFNSYGPTEATVTATAIECGDGRLPPLVGKPLPNVRAYILDQALQPVPVGVYGELCIGGIGVARGYLARPELTAERFVPDPFHGARAGFMYRSGDLARWRADGSIEIAGRIDGQVKVRGFRIELGEIEAVLARHARVQAGAVIVREDSPGERRLVAYFIPREGDTPSVSALREHLKRSLPDHMLPAAFVALKALPLTPNGKLDRAALPAPERARPALASSYAEPRTATESAIAQIWRDVLGLDQVGIHDHFFEVGGDSILAIQIVARCRQTGLQVTPRDLFKRPTISQLAEACAQSTKDVQGPQEPLTGALPFTPIQRWFLEQDFADPRHWNQAFLFEVPAHLDLDRLQQALHHVLRHHDALRLRLRRAGNEWLQEYAADEPAPEIARIELAGVDATQLAEHAAIAQASLNLASGPLLRAVHFSLGAREAGRLLLVVHHLAVDGVSWRLILEDLESAYFSLKNGELPVLPPKTASYRVWSERLAAAAKSSLLERSAAFWRAEAAKPVTELPSACNDCENLAGDARSVKTRLTRDETRALLQRVPLAYHTQINDALLTALARALQQWTGGDAFRIDLEGHGREDIAEDVDVSRTVGWFTSVFPVRLELQTGWDAGKALKSIKEQLRRIPDRGLGYGLLRYGFGDSETAAELSRSPQSAIQFNYLGQFDQVVAGSKLFRFAAESSGPWQSPASRRSHALDVQCLVRAGELEIEWTYHPALHRRDAVEGAAQAFRSALRAIIGHCLAEGVGGHTPSDFPLAALGQEAVDALSARYPDLEDVYPLSPMQRLFYVMESTRAQRESEPWQFRVDGAVDPVLLRAAIGRVVQRHAILRTAFVSEGGADPLQVVLQQVALPWSAEDWRGVPVAEQESRLAALLESERATGFDVTRAPLMRVALRRIGEQRYLLIWNMHHLCVDGWSWPLLFSEISRTYDALRQSTEPALDRACSYRSYIAWLQTHAPDSEGFWKDTLAGFGKPTPLDLGGAPSGAQAGAGGLAEATARLDQATTSALQSLARSQRVTLSVIVQGAWALLLSHYSGMRDVVFGAAFSGRPAELPEIESLIGPCVTNLPVRVRVKPKELLWRWLASLQQRQTELWQHQYAPLEQIQKWAEVPWRFRLFDSLVVFQNYQIGAAARRIGRDARLVPVAVSDNTSYRLTVMVVPDAELCLRLTYRPDQLAPEVVQTYAADLAMTLRAIAQGHSQKLAELLARLPASSRGRAAAVAVRQSKAVRPGAAAVAPRTPSEELVLGVFRELLDRTELGVFDNFFDLGGHSIAAAQLMSRLRAAANVELPLRNLFERPTVAGLAEAIDALSWSMTPLPRKTADREQIEL